MTTRPSEILNLGKGTLSSGAEADVCVFDPNEKWLVKEDGFFSRSRNSPWIGQDLTGKVQATFVKGKQVYDGKNILNPEFSDEILAIPGNS